MGHLTLKDPLVVQVLLLARIKEISATRTVHMQFKKARPPTFNGEINNGQEAEAWLHGMRKYFQVQDYSRNMKARVAIFNFTGKTSIWWEHFRKVRKINERKIVWK